MKRNGIDTEQVQAFTELLGAHPEAGAVTARTRHHWGGSYALECQTEDLTLAGEGMPRTQRVQIDMPKEFGGGDSGPVPAETLLAALGACIGQQLVEQAAVRGIDLEGLQITCEAQVDLRGAYGVDGVRPGFAGVGITASVRTDVDDEELEDLLQSAMRSSPAADSLVSPVRLHGGVQRLP